MMKIKLCDQDKGVLTIIEPCPSSYSPTLPPNYTPMSTPINIHAVDQNDVRLTYSDQPTMFSTVGQTHRHVKGKYIKKLKIFSNNLNMYITILFLKW
jgi:hypothetical protein